MKVESVDVTVFRCPTRRVSDSARHSHPGAESMTKMAMLTITVDDGVQGFSFAPSGVVYPFVVNTSLRKVLVGQDPSDRECIWQDLSHQQRGSTHQLTERTLSLVEQALWDLIGHSLRMPVYKLPGGYRDTVPAYGSTIYDDGLPGGLSILEKYAAFAEKLIARGYKTIKLHTWVPLISFAPNPKMDIKVCAAAREAIGPNTDLMVDGYHWYSRAEALRIGKALGRLSFVWFEEPMEKGSMSSRAQLAEDLLIPIVRSEGFGDKYHMRTERVKTGACDILRAGANGVGGIIPTMKVAVLAESFGMDCEVHGNGMASLAVVGMIRNCRQCERGPLHPFLDYGESAAYLNSIVDPMDDRGLVHLSQRPSLGEGINLAYIETNTVSHD